MAQRYKSTTIVPIPGGEYQVSDSANFSSNDVFYYGGYVYVVGHYFGTKYEMQILQIDPSDGSVINSLTLSDTYYFYPKICVWNDKVYVAYGKLVSGTVRPYASEFSLTLSSQVEIELDTYRIKDEFSVSIGYSDSYGVFVTFGNYTNNYYYLYSFNYSTFSVKSSINWLISTYTIMINIDVEDYRVNISYFDTDNFTYHIFRTPSFDITQTNETLDITLTNDIDGFFRTDQYHVSTTYATDDLIFWVYRTSTTKIVLIAIDLWGVVQGEYEISATSNMYPGDFDIELYNGKINIAYMTNDIDSQIVIATCNMDGTGYASEQITSESLGCTLPHISNGNTTYLKIISSNTHPIFLFTQDSSGTETTWVRVR